MAPPPASPASGAGGTGGYAAHVVGLAALWGSSYMFIKLAVDEMPPALVVATRVIVAAAVLTPLLALRAGLRGAVRSLRATGRGAWVLALGNATVPWLLLAWGETRVESGVGAVGNATTPLFVALLALRVQTSERTGALGLVGLFAGLAGVGVLVGVDPDADWGTAAGSAAVLVSSICFAASTLYAQARFASSPPLAVSAAAMLAAAVIAVPIAAATAPTQAPGSGAIAAAVALGLIGTAAAWLLLYRTLGRYGAARTSLNAYLLPVFGLGYGAVFLDEALGWNALLGLALILVGVALASRPPRRVPQRSLPEAAAR